MNAPIFFMNMISPLQKIITVQMMLVRMFLTILTVRSLFATILHQEIVL